MIENIFSKDPVPHPETCECKGTNLVTRAGLSVSCLGEKFKKEKLTPEELANLQLADEQQQRLEYRAREKKMMRQRVYEVTVQRLLSNPPERAGLKQPKTEEEAELNIRTLCDVAYVVATIATGVWFELEGEDGEKDEGQKEAKTEDVP